MPADSAAPPITTADDPGGRAARRLTGVVALAAAVPVVYVLASPHNFYDLRIYMSAMRWWSAGNPLYDYVQPDRVQGELWFTYPPFAALLLRPFSYLRVEHTIAIFTILTIVAVAVTTWWLVAPLAVQHRAPRWYVVGIAVPLVFAAESTRETITFGQINMLLVVLILADLLFAVPRGSRWAGVGIGLATAIKLYPGIFIVYLLASRRWREAATASAAAAGATLLAAALVPRDSWRFWTHELWSTDRVGRTDYTGNQSLFGMLSRFSAPEKPDRLLWLGLVALVAGYGLWRAARAARAGDGLTGLTLTGLVGSLASPITWPHHVYWFIPAVLVLADAGLRTPDTPPSPDPLHPPDPPHEADPPLAAGPPHWPGLAGPRPAAEPARRPGARAALVPLPARSGRRRRRALLVTAAVLYAFVAYGVVSFHDWGAASVRTDSPPEFVLRNMYVLLALLLLVILPTRRPVTSVPATG